MLFDFDLMYHWIGCRGVCVLDYCKTAGERSQKSEKINRYHWWKAPRYLWQWIVGVIMEKIIGEHFNGEEAWSLCVLLTYFHVSDKILLGSAGMFPSFSCLLVVHWSSDSKSTKVPLNYQPPISNITSSIIINIVVVVIYQYQLHENNWTHWLETTVALRNALLISTVEVGSCMIEFNKHWI